MRALSPRVVYSQSFESSRGARPNVHAFCRASKCFESSRWGVLRGLCVVGVVCVVCVMCVVWIVCVVCDVRVVYGVCVLCMLSVCCAYCVYHGYCLCCLCDVLGVCVVNVCVVCCACYKYIILYYMNHARVKIISELFLKKFALDIDLYMEIEIFINIMEKIYSKPLF